MRRWQKLMCLVVVLTLLLSIVCVSASADSLVKTEGDFVNSSKRDPFVLGLPLTVYLGGVSRDKNTFTKFDNAASILIDPSLDYSSSGNSMFKGWGVSDSTLNPNFSAGRFVNRTFYGDFIDYDDFYYDSHVFRFGFIPFGSGEYYTYRDYGNAVNVGTIINNMASALNGVSLNSDRNSLFNSFACSYDGLITYDGLTDYMYQLPNSVSLSLLTNYSSVVSSIESSETGPIFNYNYDNLIRPSFEVSYSYDYSFYSDEIDDFRTVSYSSSYTMVTSINSSSSVVSVDPRVYDQLDANYESALSRAFTNGASGDYFKIVTYTVPLQPLYNTLVEQLDSYASYYVSNLKFDIVPSNTSFLYGSNTALNNYASSVGVPMRRAIINYDSIYADPIADVDSSGAYDYFKSTSTLLMSGLSEKFEVTYSEVDFGYELVDWLGTTLRGFMNTELIGTISLGDILYVVAGLGILFIILKIFFGG